MDVIEKFELLSVSLYVRQKWENPLVAWNKSEYGGIVQVNLDPSTLWKPDIYLYNNADSGYDGSLYGFTAKIKVNYSGTNTWLAPKIFTTSCKINVKYFPFDQQECRLKFGSWTYDANSVDIFPEEDQASIKGYQKNGEWDFIGFPCKRSILYYPCCPDSPFTDVTCTLIIRRKTLYYWVNLIIPCMLITVLSLLSFIVSTDSGERVGLVITDLLALTVFMLIVADILPPTSEVVPVISIYIICSTIEVGLALVATTIVVQCYHTNPDINVMPFWVKYFICQKLGGLLGITHVKDKKEEEQAKELDDETKTDGPKIQPRNQLFGFWNLPPAKSLSYETLVGASEAEATCRTCIEARTAALGESRTANSFIQHASMYKPLPPYSSSSLRKRSDYDDQMDAGSSVEANQPETNLDCACVNDPQIMRVLKGVIHRQDHLVEGITKLIDNMEEQDEGNSKRDDWILAATVIDRFFLILFALVILLSTILTFATIPSYPEVPLA
ncbi:neuronal acetylcholine receptor subunit alpha-7 isoform X2 [Nematostella vectensis]|nr:neuronal acetylcholine receptor subunit alpha-7 isoform X2 [Nematostella vectensis]